MTYKDRYAAAHLLYQHERYPSATRDFGPLTTKFPNVDKANGLTTFICNFLNWSGHRATRISSSGRLIDAPQRQPSGISLTTKKWIPGSTRKGTADISATINGRSVMIEIKVGRDRPSEYQISEQERERRAGGVYEFIHDPDEFFQLYDKIVTL